MLMVVTSRRSWRTSSRCDCPEAASLDSPAPTSSSSVSLLPSAALAARSLSAADSSAAEDVFPVTTRNSPTPQSTPHNGAAAAAAAWVSTYRHFHLTQTTRPTWPRCPRQPRRHHLNQVCDARSPTLVKWTPSLPWADGHATGCYWLRCLGAGTQRPRRAEVETRLGTSHARRIGVPAKQPCVRGEAAAIGKFGKGRPGASNRSAR